MIRIGSLKLRIIVNRKIKTRESGFSDVLVGGVWDDHDDDDEI